MECLKRFNKKMSYSGGSLRNEHIISSKNFTETTFQNDASYQYDMFLWKLGMKYDSGCRMPVRIYNRRYSAANGTTMEFQSLIDTPVIIGDIIYDLKNNQYLICTESFNLNSVHYQGKFTVCNWILKWQNKNGEILEYPCYDANTTQYNSGEQSNKHMTISSSQHNITLPCDENTVMLSTPQRFYLDKNTANPTSYIVTANDTTSYNYGEKGLVKVTLYEHPNNSATDRPDLGICDYIEVDKCIEKKKNCVKPFKAIIGYDTTIIKSGGDAQSFKGQFYNELGEEIDNISPQWTIVSDFGQVLQVKEIDNCISIGIDNDDYIDEEFKLVCNGVNEDGLESSANLIIKIESLL